MFVKIQHHQWDRTAAEAAAYDDDDDDDGDDDDFCCCLVTGWNLLGGVDGYLCVILVSVGDWVPDMCSRGLGLHGPSVLHQHPGNARKTTRLVVEVLLEIHFSSDHSGKYSSVFDGFLLSTVGVSALVNAGIHPSGRHTPKQTPPWADPPPSQTPPGRHTP